MKRGWWSLFTAPGNYGGSIPLVKKEYTLFLINNFREKREISEFEITVHDLDSAVIPAHRAAVGIGRHPFRTDLLCPGRVHGDGELAVPVKVAAGMAHFEVGCPCLLEFYHVADMCGDAGTHDTLRTLLRGSGGRGVRRGSRSR